MRPPLAQYQTDAIFCKERYGLIEATTKSGKTHGNIVWLWEQAALGGRRGRNYWWVAPSYVQAKIAYRRLKLALRDIADECEFNETELTITLPNGAVMWFKTGEKPDNLFGEDVYAAVIDEASRLREDAWFAVRSTLTATRGPIRIVGNVKGKKNWFYVMCRKAEASEPGYHYAKITCHDAVKAGIILQEEVDSARRDLPERVFKELYEAEPSDDGGNPFGISAIRARVVPFLSPLPPVAFGVDLAKSHDWTVIIGLDENGNVCRYERFQLPWTETLRRVRASVGSVHSLIDSTGVGDPIVEGLQRNDGVGRSANFEGFKFSSQSKQRLMEGLAVAIQQGKVAYPDGVIVSELESYEYTYTKTGVQYTAPEGAHDDAVCALALAVACRMSADGRPRWRPI